MNEVFTIGVGGAAGEGAKGTGIKIGNFLREKGFEVYISFEYPSLIRGGHNFARITASREKVWCDHSKLDILVCLNGETEELHRSELKEGVWVLTGLSTEEILGKVEEFVNSKNLVPHQAEQNFAARNELVDGNTAFAKGLQAAGLDFYFAYPMTPSTSILHYLASEQSRRGLKVVQPENEIAVINMALGAAYAGKRAAVGTATGGFALMQEAFSFSGMAELPLVAGVSQRQAPATGVPTHSSQSDLRFVIHAGHGEFPRIVLAPGDPEEAFKAGADALNMAWEYRVPVVVLLDKILSEHMMTAEVEKLKSLKVEKSEDQKVPGMPGVVVKANSYEHSEDGITIEDHEEVKKAVEKRFEKKRRIAEELKNYECLKVSGDSEAETAIVFWGSTKGAILEAAKNLSKPVKLVQVICAEPFPAERIKNELANKGVICVEGNHEGQLASLIREKTGIEIKDKILRYDSMPFDPDELKEEVDKRI